MLRPRGITTFITLLIRNSYLGMTPRKPLIKAPIETFVFHQSNKSCLNLIVHDSVAYGKLAIPESADVRR